MPRKNGLRWTQGFLGRLEPKTKDPEAYGVNGIPAIWLIGPDGQGRREGPAGEEASRRQSAGCTRQGIANGAATQLFKSFGRAMIGVAHGAIAPVS